MAKKTKKAGAETPLMKQYNTIKSRYPDAILLFRVGDFYETFGEDAVRASGVLGIVLTKRRNGAAAFIDLAGFPHHSLEVYLPKLVRAGYRVAICDQLEDPKSTKKIVRRGVTELVTPGVSINDQVLDQKQNNFLASVHFGDRELGVAFLDISTGEFLIAQGDSEYIEKLIQSFSPNEILYQKQHKKTFEQRIGKDTYSYRLEDWVFSETYAREKLLHHFKTRTLKGFGVEELELGIIAAGACLFYMEETKHDHLNHVVKIARIDASRFVWMDKFTLRNLELLSSNNEHGKTLLDCVDETITPMGGRMMKRWMVLPLKNKEEIDLRQDGVGALIKAESRQDEISANLKQIGDLERLISKVAVKRINPREVFQIHRSIEALQPIRTFCLEHKSKSLQALGNAMNHSEEINKEIKQTLTDQPPAILGKGSTIRSGKSKELDEYRSIHRSSKSVLDELLEKETKRTGIPSLKISFNSVFGYYIEVRNTHKEKVPVGWIRKQTLVNAERYITEELKELEQKIVGAEEQISILEARLFQELVEKVSLHIAPLQKNAAKLAELDCLLSFAHIANLNNYTRPTLTEELSLHIKEGRHPVIEKELPIGESYIANDVFLDHDQQQIMMITGPNMSGKSALLRQTALIVIMAQMGCYVPAKHAEIGLIDKIFTRVGASDNLSGGESTFMVEMNETASILNNLSDRSLVLLDEIGRGTSTYDGVSIAWAIAEYIHNHPSFRAKTLFATHYHELNEMTKSFERIKNYNVSIKEVGKDILFLRKLKPGGSEHSFGIHVAKMAGMPMKVVQRAQHILKRLEKEHENEDTKDRLPQGDEVQLSFFQLDDPVLEQIRDEISRIDIDRLTPVEALLKLHEIKKLTGG